MTGQAAVKGTHAPSRFPSLTPGHGFRMAGGASSSSHGQGAADTDREADDKTAEVTDTGSPEPMIGKPRYSIVTGEKIGEDLSAERDDDVIDHVTSVPSSTSPSPANFQYPTCVYETHHLQHSPDTEQRHSLDTAVSRSNTDGHG